MKNIACINAIQLTEYAHRAIAGKKNAFESAVDTAFQLPGVERVVVFALTGTRSPSGNPKLVMETRDAWELSDLLGALKSCSEGIDSIFYYFGDSPFLDPALSGKMHENHVRYFADYSFADGFPHGLAPEIISARIIGQLIKLSEKSSPAIKRESIFDIIKKDINSFDVETELSPVDMRFLRAELHADKKRNFMLIERIAGLGNTDSAAILGAMEKNPEILRTLPSFYAIQVTERCPYPCFYCPYPGLGIDVTGLSGEMPLDRFSSLLGKIEDFSQDAYIDISLWGDPAYHSRLVDIARACSERPGIELVIETSAIGYDPEILETIARLDCSRLTWIASLDASRPETYERIRGKGFAEAMRTTDRLFGLFPGRVYVQAVRMKENEEDVELFFTTWKAKTENVIIQKYDHFSGILPERKVTDLSPVKRMPCWHVKRDMAILLDGTVPLCREDLGRSVKLGNAFEEDLGAIWERGSSVYMDHVNRRYTDLCKRCDEYYTFNF